MRTLHLTSRRSRGGHAFPTWQEEIATKKHKKHKKRRQRGYLRGGLVGLHSSAVGHAIRLAQEFRRRRDWTE